MPTHAATTTRIILDLRVLECEKMHREVLHFYSRPLAGPLRPPQSPPTCTTVNALTQTPLS